MLADSLYILIVLTYAFLCWKGILLMSCNGVVLDSDLQTYAQGMAGEHFPELFAADPVLHDRNAANSIPNLQRMLAGVLLVNNDFASALLASGAIAIFIFYTGWYVFGRVVFRYPVYAILLALLTGVTVWVGWGTFWGITHSDPVPRVFFAAIFPFLLLLALFGLSRPLLRPVTMFACGLCMWVHGVSALNSGAMIFMAYLFLKAPGYTIKRHLFNLMLCLVAFFFPVLCFLWSSLFQARNFGNAELAVFTEFFNMRWQKDFSNFGGRFARFFQFTNPAFDILICGFLCWLAIARSSTKFLHGLCRMFPCFLLAIAIVTTFCWAETRFAPDLGRLPMGHELVRGIRFCVPLAWIMITGFCYVHMPLSLTRIVTLLVFAAILLFTNDRQYIGAQLAIAEYTGLRTPLYAKAAEEMGKAEEEKKLLTLVADAVPEGEAVFCDGEIMAIRYKALRPLHHSFKDGYVFYYNKDFPASEKWLKTEKMIRTNPPQSYMEAWLESGVPWFLSGKGDVYKNISAHAEMVGKAGNWILYRRKG